MLYLIESSPITLSQSPAPPHSIHAIPLLHCTYTIDEIVKAGPDVENAVLNKAISLISRDKGFTNGNKTIVFE